MYKIERAHLQCVNNHYAKFEYKRMKTVADYANRTHLKHFRWENVYVQHQSKMRKYLSNVHKMAGAHLQCVNNHYLKFENREMKTVGVTDYTNQTPSKHFWTEKCLSSPPPPPPPPPPLPQKISMKCAQNRWCTSSICEKSICKH